MRITEIFHSIQGESSHVGQPCVFVRLTGCPLRCTWCDTEYAFYGGTDISLEEILVKVKSYGCPLVEVTGGEPLAQPEAIPLTSRLCDAGYRVLIETSGAIDIAPVDERAHVIDRKDYDWACNVIAQYDLVNRCALLMSPVFGSLEPRLLAEWVLADGLPVRFQLQVHKFIWAPDMRGV
jgi:7-carboxy-7-deazaguanine synthase